MLMAGDKYAAKRMRPTAIGIWTAMAAVRLRDVLSGAKE